MRLFLVHSAIALCVVFLCKNKNKKQKTKKREDFRVGEWSKNKPKIAKRNLSFCLIGEFCAIKAQIKHN